MRHLLAVALLFLLVPLAQAQAPIHVTIEKADISFDFPAAQDASVNHFEGCFTQGASPLACASTATTFQSLPIATKAADPANPGTNLYHAAIPNTLAANRPGESTLLVVRACAGAAIGAGCGGLSAGAGFILDLSSPSDLRVTQNP
jgi:hypothetical protein